MAEGDGEEIAWLDELVGQVRHLHDLIISETGGLAGEHTARLFAACARPFQSAFGEPIYPSEVEQAAALFHSLIADHPFADGNKRTATIAAIAFLADAGHLIDAPASLRIRALGEVAVETAQGDLEVAEVVRWFRFLFPADQGRGVSTPGGRRRGGHRRRRATPG